MEDAASRFIVFGVPSGTPIALTVQPRLESWDAKSSRSQVQLAAYLDHLAIQIGRLPDTNDQSLGLALAVGLPAGMDLTAGGRDLDNYLYPILRRLGHQRFASAQAQKRYGDSTVLVGPVRPSNRPGWAFASAATGLSAVRREWKEDIQRQINTQVLSAEPPGPLELELCFRVGANRNWSWLWKPAIDSLGPILGADTPSRPFHPRDDRFVRLGLHCVVDPALRSRVEIGVWWRAP